MADFGNLVAKYLDLQKKAGGSPKPAKQPAKLAESREQIAAKVLAERADAKLKEIFSLPKFFDRGSTVVEIAGDNVYFQTLSRTGQTIDSGTVARQ